MFIRLPGAINRNRFFLEMINVIYLQIACSHNRAVVVRIQMTLVIATNNSKCNCYSNIDNCSDNIYIIH